MIDPEIPEWVAACTGDPRADGETFHPEWFPLADGAAFPSQAPDSAPRRNRLRFLSVYYRLNQACAELGRLEDGDPARGPVLRRIRELTFARDTLEDAFAPYGFIGEPELAEGMVRNVVFTQPPDRFLPSARGGASSFSLHLEIPVPEFRGASSPSPRAP